MTKYLMFAHFYGDDNYSATRSPRLLLETSNPRYNVTLNPVNYLEYNSTANLSGKVTDSNGKGMAVNGIKITIYLPGTDNKTSILTVNSNSNGVFNYSFAVTRHGEYRITALVNESNDYGSGTDSFTVLAGIKDSIMTLKTDASVYRSNQTILMTLTLTDSDGTPLKDQGVDIFLDDNTTALLKRRTTTDGVITATLKISDIGEHHLVAVYNGITGSINPSSTSPTDCTFSIEKHITDLVVYDSALYPGWKLRFKAVDELGSPLKSSTFKVNINNTNYTCTSDSNGFFSTPTLNLPENQYEVKVTGGPWGLYDAISHTYNIHAFNKITETLSPSTVINTQSSVPYRVWNNLSNLQKEDGVVATCGKKCTSSEALGGSSGSWNTPAPLRCSNNGYIDDGVIEELTVKMKCRTVSCSSSTAKPKITAPSLTINGNTQQFTLNTSDNQLPFPNLAWISCTFPVNELGDMHNYTFDITFPKNGNGNFGLVEIDCIQTTIKYTPEQSEVE